jgi:hypothetical protein
MILRVRSIIIYLEIHRDEETEDGRLRAVEIVAVENPVFSLLARQREPRGEGLAVAFDDIVAARVERDLFGPEMMCVRHSAARRLVPAWNRFAVGPLAGVTPNTKAAAVQRRLG